MKGNQETGKLGEDLALSYLQGRGYRLRARNYRYGHSEIDLIMEQAETLIFVEVKARRGSAAFGFPEEAVSTSKVQSVQRGAEQYLLENNWQRDIRFDIVAVRLGRQPVEIKHFKDAF